MNSDSLIDRIISEDVFYKAVMGLIIGLPVVELITEILFRFNESFVPSTIEPIVLAAFGVMGTLLTVLYLCVTISKNRILRTADIFYFTLIFFMVISAVFSRNPGVYCGGDANRCENPLHFLAYFWLFFAGSLIDTWKYRRNIIFSFLGVSILEGIFAFLQTFNIELAFSYLYRADRSAYGLTQNSNYYGALCVIFVAAIAGLYIFADNIIKSKAFRFALPAIAAFVFYTMLGSRARLAWVGAAALVVFYVISLIIMSRKSENKADLKPAVKRSLIILGVFTAVFLFAFFFTDYIREVAVRSYWEVANGKPEMIGSKRFYIWNMAVKSIPQNWLTGVGLDNFQYVFLSSPDFSDDMYFKDKAHNEYLQILVTQGIPAFINYMALLIYTLTGAVKSILGETSKEKRAATWILLGAFVAYASQAFFNNSITYVVIYFWLVMGLIIPRSPVSISKAGKK